MKHREFDWSCEESATKHGVSKENIESAFLGRGFTKKLERDSYMLLSKDHDGNLLEIFFRITVEGEYMVFHCMSMRDKFKKMYQRLGQ